MKRIVIGVLAAAAMAGLWAMPGQGEPPAETKKIMKQKLTHAQALLEGVATRKFDSIERHAAALIALTDQAAWKAVEDPQYMIYSADFRRACEKLVDHAKKGNLDACALDYVQMTLACVNCHTFMRDKGIVDAGPPAPHAALAAIEP